MNNYSLVISIISIFISIITLCFNLYRSMPHLKIEQLNEKYSGTILKQSDYLTNSDADLKCINNGEYTSCILIDLLIANNSSEPITIKSFSSKNTLSMDSISNNYGVQAGIGEPNNYKILKKAVKFKGSELFILPLNIPPYNAVQKRVQLFITDDFAKKIMRLDSVNIKLKVNTARKCLFKDKSYISKVKIRPFNILARNNKKYSGKEHFLVHGYVKNSTSGDGSMVSTKLIPNEWLRDE